MHFLLLAYSVCSGRQKHLRGRAHHREAHNSPGESHIGGILVQSAAFHIVSASRSSISEQQRAASRSRQAQACYLLAEVGSACLVKERNPGSDGTEIHVPIRTVLSPRKWCSGSWRCACDCLIHPERGHFVLRAPTSRKEKQGSEGVASYVAQLIGFCSAVSLVLLYAILRAMPSGLGP